MQGLTQEHGYYRMDNEMRLPRRVPENNVWSRATSGIKKCHMIGSEIIGYEFKLHACGEDVEISGSYRLSMHISNPLLTTIFCKLPTSTTLRGTGTW